MKARRFSFMDDYATVYKWWIDWKWKPISPEFLPLTGIMISNDGKDICCAWIYRTDSSMCVADFFISDRYSNKKLRKGCVEFLINKLIEEANRLGFKAIFSSVRNQNLINKLEKAGFAFKDLEMTNLTKVL